MDQAEYDRLYKKKCPVKREETLAEGEDRPPRITVVNTTPQDRYNQEMESLQEKIVVVGRTEGGAELIRRTGGADTAGNEQWTRLLRKCDRLR
jgi:hypothetical protein